MREKVEDCSNISMYKIYELKIQSKNMDYFNLLFLESKWFYNALVASNDPFKYDKKSIVVSVFNKKDQTSSTREFRVLTRSMRDEILTRMHSSIKSLRTKLKKGLRVGDLKFKPIINSIPLNNQTFNLVHNRVCFMSLGGTKGYKRKWYRVRGINQLPGNGVIKFGNLIRKSNGVYLHVCMEIPRQNIGYRETIGLDFGIKDAFVFSDGSVVNFDCKKEYKKLRRKQRQLSRKQKNSKNYFKTKLLLNKQNEHIKNIKRDATNKLINKLNNFQVVFQDEMLQVWKRKKKGKASFGKQIQNSILGRVKSKLKQNSDNLMLNRTLPTTKQCYECDKLNSSDLDIRIYKCDCGYIEDRDIHSARNMLKFSGVEYTLSEKESDLQCMLSSLQSKHLSVKQKSTIISSTTHEKKQGRL